jgi:hypothetical protein
MSHPHHLSDLTEVQPVMSSPLHDGASSQRESALMYRQEVQVNQNNMNNSIGGGKKSKYRNFNYKKRKPKQFGGNGTLRSDVTVPSFSSTGPSTGGDSATANSMNANSSLLQSGANSVCDHCIGDNSNTPTCQGPQCNPNYQTGGNNCGVSCGINLMNGGTKKYRKTRKYVKSKKSKKSKRSKKSKKSKRSKKSKKSKRSKKSKV